MPTTIQKQLNGLRAWLADTPDDWGVWTDWYEDRLAGKRPRWKDVEIFRVTLNEEADWDKGPAHVNALIKAKIAEKVAIGGQRQRRTKSEEEATGSHRNHSVADAAVLKRKRIPKPKTAIGKSALANREVIVAQISAVNWFIDQRLAHLEENYGANDRDAIDAEIAELGSWRAILDDTQIAIAALVTNGDEKKIDTASQAFRQALIDFLKTQGKETIDLGARSAIFATLLGIEALCGTALPVALISGVMVGGKPVASMIASVWGKAKSAADGMRRKGRC